MRIIHAAPLALLTVFMTSPAFAQRDIPRQIRELVAMSPEQHAALVTLEDDDLEAEATFHTMRSFQERRGLLRVVWNDIFLRAYVEKRTGTPRYQVYFVFRGQAPSWPRLRTANVSSPDGLQVIDLRQVSSDVDCAGAGIYGQCTYTEHVVFDVGEDVLRSVAAAYSPNNFVAWQMRFKGQSGIDVDEGLVSGEVAGLLQRVDAYRASRSFSNEPPNPPDQDSE
ncbi:hypothetical protein [Alteraurantiacibacter palmitatis]|uniref:Uncharacterized protein n=1 Tax=Alteraurantiacibacter palmitatis TaxID=2054628 RepID=A0ABV7E3R1_9SPHN